MKTINNNHKSTIQRNMIILCCLYLASIHNATASSSSTSSYSSGNNKSYLYFSPREEIPPQKHVRPSSHGWLQPQPKNNNNLQKKKESSLHLFDSFRGGGNANNNNNDDSSSSSSSTSLVPSPPILEPEIEEPEENQNNNNKKSATESLTSALKSTSSTLKKIRRTQIITFLLLRLTFLLLLPLSALLFAITLATSALMTSLRILTLTFCFTDISRIIYATSRAMLALLLSCFTGLFSPPFAVFGLLAALSIAALDMAEPVIRIRYKREMKKVAHLTKLIRDPVLLETLGTAMRSASAVAVLGGKVVGDTVEVGGRKITSAVAASSSSKRIASSGEDGETGESGGGGMLRIFKRDTAITTITPSPTELITAEQIENAEVSKELVETLLSSPEAIKAKTKVVRRLPEPVVKWAKEQFQSIRDSGVLEIAASKALAALQKELRGAVEFMPYLEAIETVRRQQVLNQKMMEGEEDGKSKGK